MAITYTLDDVRFDLRGRQRLRAWIEQVVRNADKRVGEIGYVFCSDDHLLTVNRQFLNHDTYTDIITFDYVEGDVISGDIMISVDRVAENAVSFGNTFEQELLRVIIHGILHLLGQGDKTDEDSAEMRRRENLALQLWNTTI